MMTDLDKAFAWSYNVFDAEKFRQIASGEGINFDIDVVNGKLSPALERLTMDRIGALRNGTLLEMNFADDVASYNVTRLIAVMSKSKQWYVNKEAALFKTRVAGMHDSIKTINVFFGKDVVQELSPVEAHDVARHDTDPPKLRDAVKVRWQYFSSLLKDRRYMIKNGWMYVPLSIVKNFVVVRYKRCMEHRLRKDWKSLKDDSGDTQNVLAPYTNLLDGSSPEPEVSHPESTEITYIIALSPLCIKELDSDIQRGVDIGYEAYVKIGFYLKTFLDIDALKRYFYERNPVNARNYSSVDQYIKSIKNLNYALKYWYGESGSSTSYNSYACKKIADAGSCPFMFSKMIERVVARQDGDVLSLLDEQARTIVFTNIKTLSQRKWRSWACGAEFCARFSIEPTERVKINYPVVYFNKAVDIVKSRHPPSESGVDPSSAT